VVAAVAAPEVVSREVSCVMLEAPFASSAGVIVAGAGTEPMGVRVPRRDELELPEGASIVSGVDGGGADVGASAVPSGASSRT